MIGQGYEETLLQIESETETLGTLYPILCIFVEPLVAGHLKARCYFLDNIIMHIL